MRNDLVLNSIVGALRNNLASKQVALRIVRSAIDNFLRVGAANPR